MEYKRAAELHNALFERLAEDERLTLVKNTGDGYFARTTSVAAAVRFALRFQHGMRGMQWPSFALKTRVGIHAGEVADITTLGQADVIAPAADLVARVMGLALGGQILLTRGPFDEARHFVREHPDAVEGLSLTWLAHGPYLFKGCEEPVEVFEVGLSCYAPLTAPPDGEKAKRAIRPGDEETLGWRPADGLEIPGRPGWRLAEKLGAGGFGEVWAGEHAKTRERRAFKFCFDAERLRALKREVTLTRLLRETLGERDDIVRIYDLRLDEPPYFLESELATEGNLLQWAERQGGLAKIPLETRIELVAATAAAIGAAHSVGVLHKDIKPTNLLIFTERDGRVRPRLVDFGIGTLADSSVLAQFGITGGGFTGATIQHSSGTPTYSPPEYLAGKPFTMQGDVYSLGVMLYQLVTGKADAPLAEGWQRDVPDELLREDIATCVDGDPAQRLPSAAELTTRLRDLAKRRDAREAERATAATEAARRKRQRALAFATAAALLIAAIAIPLALWARKEQQNAVVEKDHANKLAADLGKSKEAIQKSKEDLQRKLHEASMADYSVAVQRIEKDNKWHEGVAHLARALEWEPDNQLAAQWLYSTLSFYAVEKQTWRQKILRHNSKVRWAQFSPDGSRIVTVCGDLSEPGCTQLWDAVTGKPIGEPLHHGDDRSAKFSPDGMRIVITGNDLTVGSYAQVWDAVTGKPIGEPLRSEDKVRSAQFSPDGSRIVTASFDKTAQVWDPATGKPIGEPLHHEYEVNSAQFSPDGSRIVTACADGLARVWDATTGKIIGEPLRHELSVLDAQFSPDGTCILTVSNGNTARLWDVATGKSIGEPLFGKRSMLCAQFSPDGSRIVTATLDKTAQVWNLATGKPIGEPVRHEAYVNSAQFSPDGTQIVTASDDKTACVWDTAAENPLGEPLRHRDKLCWMEFSPDGSCIVSICGGFSEPGYIQVWEATTGKPLGNPLRDEASVLLAYNSDGSRILTCSGEKTAQAWDVATGMPIGEPLGSEVKVNSAQFSPNGSRIVTLHVDNNARLWNTATGKPTGELLHHESGVNDAQFSLDGSRIVTVCEDLNARVWDTTTGKAIGKPMQHECRVNNAQFSPDGSRIVTVCVDHSARLWNAATGKPICEPLRHEDSLTCVKFSPDGTRIVTASMDKTVRMWDANTGKPIGAPLHHDSGVSSAQFSPDVSHILTACVDGLVRVWGTTTGKPMGEPLSHEFSVLGAQFSPDGSRILTFGEDKVARVWDAATLIAKRTPVPSWMLARARAVAGLEFNSDGKMRDIPAEKRIEIVMESPPEGNDWSKLARWLAQPVNERTLTPDSKFTCRQIAERERDSGFKEGIESALRYDPNVPLAHVLLAKFEENPQRAAFLRKYGLRLLPDDAVLWARAAASLVEQRDFSFALQAADKALTLDPKNEDAQRSRQKALDSQAKTH